MLNKEKIEKLLMENNVYNIRWDSINNEFQGHKFKRLFMIKLVNLKQEKNL